MSEDGAVVMICGGIGVLLVSLVVDWEALCRRQRGPLIATPRSREGP
jgi:hypothetical protein